MNGTTQVVIGGTTGVIIIHSPALFWTLSGLLACVIIIDILTIWRRCRRRRRMRQARGNGTRDT